jgi:tetratricopeptide (TPR) repeat protein
MGGGTESSKNDGRASAYCQRAIEAFRRGDLDASEELCRTAAELYEQAGDVEASKAYFLLAILAHQRGELDAAERWHRKSLEIAERTGDELGAARTCYNLSRVAIRRADFDAAEEWLRNSIRIAEKQGDDIIASKSYQQMGFVAYKRGDLDAAGEWWRKAVKLDERTGDERGAARTCHYLGLIAESRGDFDGAEQWLRNSLHLHEKLGDDTATSQSYHQLGMIAYRRGDLDAAEQWYRKSLEIDERTGDEHGAAKTYHNLSAVADARLDVESAENCLLKSLQIKERLGDRVGVAHSYQQLGIVAGTRQDLEAAEQWFVQSLEIFEGSNDEIGVASCCMHLGSLAGRRSEYDVAKKWYERALAIYDKRHIMDWAAKTRAALEHLSQHSRNKGRKKVTTSRWSLHRRRDRTRLADSRVASLTEADRHFVLGLYRCAVRDYQPRIEQRTGVQLGTISVRDFEELDVDFLSNVKSRRRTSLARLFPRAVREWSLRQLQNHLASTRAGRGRACSACYYGNGIYVSFSHHLCPPREYITSNVVHELSHALWERVEGVPLSHRRAWTRRKRQKVQLLSEGFATYAERVYFLDVYPPCVRTILRQTPPEKGSIYDRGLRRVEELVQQHGPEIFLEIPKRWRDL